MDLFRCLLIEIYKYIPSNNMEIDHLRIWRWKEQFNSGELKDVVWKEKGGLYILMSINQTILYFCKLDQQLTYLIYSYLLIDPLLKYITSLYEITRITIYRGCGLVVRHWPSQTGGLRFESHPRLGVLYPLTSRPETSRISRGPMWFTKTDDFDKKKN